MIANGELHMEDIAIERENSRFRLPHSHLTPPHQRTQTNICVRLIYRQTLQTVGYVFAADSIYAFPSILEQSIMP